VDKKGHVREEMERLLEAAELVFDEDSERAHRYAEIAWRLKLKSRVDLPERWKRSVCRSCQGFLVPGRSARLRVRRGRVVTKCLRCGEVRRFVIR